MPPPLTSAPPLHELAQLADSPLLGDRAFAAGVLELLASSAPAGELRALRRRMLSRADQAHAELRARIAAGGFDRAAFFAELARTPLELRDHWVEEVLGIAYPPLTPRPLPLESVGYSPSSIDEVSFVIEQAQLSPGRVLVDLGSGLGKVTLLVSLISGADAIGLELDPELVAGARAAATALKLERARFIQGDVLEVPLPDADVYYMFIPLQRSDALLDRLEPIARRRPFALFAQGLDVTRAPWLRASGRSSYWLQRFDSVQPR